MQCHESVNLPQILPLWPKERTPWAGPEDGEFPRFTYYLPSMEHRTGQSMLILPGGGYGMVSTPKEGHRPAQLMAAHGIACGVLEYRHAPQRHPVPLIDAQRGMRLLRLLAKEHGLDQQRVGVMGFSAGGHLAGCVANFAEEASGKIGDAADNFSCGADFSVLVYPVVNLESSYAHIGSGKNLLGDNPSSEQLRKMSVHHNISAQCGPMLVIHGQADQTVPLRHALDLYEALTEARIAATLHIYEKMEHGVGMAANHPWMNELLSWLAKR